MYSNILVPTDGSPTSYLGLRLAATLARQDRARLTILHVVPLDVAYADMQMASPELFEHHLSELRRRGRAVLDAAAASVADVPARTMLREVKVCRPADAIVEEASAGYDLVVMGTHGKPGLRKRLLGGEAARVLRNSPIPLLMVRAGRS